MRRVRAYVPARLHQAVIFGSTARGEAGPDSDVDVLLIFRRLPPNREPHATFAEVLAAQLARESAIPVEPWSVSLPDLQRGVRTPMLVDALADGVSLWPAFAPVPRIPFTPDDARFCARALLDRIGAGGVEFQALVRAGREQAAAARLRDDLVRGCVAAMLLRGETRPRRAAAVRRFAACFDPPGAWRPVLEWAANSFGATGNRVDLPVRIAPGGWEAAAAIVDRIAAGVRAETR